MACGLAPSRWPQTSQVLRHQEGQVSLTSGKASGQGGETMTVNGAVGDLRWGRGQFIVPCQDLTLVLEQVTVQPSVSEQPECLWGWEEGPRDEERGSLEGFVS